MELDDATIDRVATSFLAVEQAIALRVGRIEPVLPAEQILEPWQQYALAIVDTAFTDTRPVYWSNNGRDPASLGLDPYLVRQGVAFKLHNGSLPDDPPWGVTAVHADPLTLRGTGRWLDVPRTESLLSEVFVHRSDLPHWDHWPDPSTGVIPYFYSWAYNALGVAATNRGDDVAAEEYFGLGEEWMDLAF
jgi:hypothetical protein